MNKYSVPYTSLSFVHNASRQHNYYRPVRYACGPSGRVTACVVYIRPIRFEIRFEGKKTIRRSLLCTRICTSFLCRHEAVTDSHASFLRLIFSATISGVDPCGSGVTCPQIFTLSQRDIHINTPTQCLRTSILKRHALESS